MEARLARKSRLWVWTGLGGRSNRAGLMVVISSLFSPLDATPNCTEAIKDVYNLGKSQKVIYKRKMA